MKHLDLMLPIAEFLEVGPRDLQVPNILPKKPVRPCSKMDRPDERTFKPCKINASWHVAVDLRTRKRQDPVRVITPLLVCNRHRCELTVDQVIWRMEWKKLVAAVVGRGHEKPRRRLTQLHFYWLSGSDYPLR